MRAWDFLIEDYKTTAVKFVASGIDQAQVDDYILKFKELSNKQKLAGDEKNIDTWAKKTFSEFKEFVDAKETEVADVANKKAEKKDPGKSKDITTPEQRQNGWKIIIPLDKKASVFYGNLDCMSDWCIAKTEHDFFNQYFYERNSNLIFCLNDQKKKWAIEIKAPSPKYRDRIILYDIKDKQITESEFEKQTKLNFADILRNYKPHIEEIKEFKQPYFDKINLAKLAELKSKFPDATLETWHTHPTGGGWVQNTAKVADTAFVGPEAIVSGNAWVRGYARIFHNAWVSGNAQVYDKAEVSWNARVLGNARVSWNARVSGNTGVSGNAWIFGDAQVAGAAEVYQNARVSGDAEVSGNAKVSGDARVYQNARVSGYAKVFGNAVVFGKAEVRGNAVVSENAQVRENARVYDDAQVSGNAVVFGAAQVNQNAEVSGDAQVSGQALVSGDAQVSGNTKVSGNEWRNKT